MSKLCEIYWRTCEVNGEACPKKNISKEAKYECPAMYSGQKDSPWGGGDTDSPLNKVFQAQRSIKKVMLTVLWNIKGLIIVDLLEKASSVNSASYCEHIRQKSTNLLKRQTTREK